MSSLPLENSTHVFDEEAFKNAKKATLARMNSSSSCSSSSAIITTASTSTDESNAIFNDPKAASKRSCPKALLPPFSQKDFERLWTTALERLGFTSTEEIESGNFLRDANSDFKDGKSRSSRRNMGKKTVSKGLTGESVKVGRKDEQNLNIQTRAN